MEVDHLPASATFEQGESSNRLRSIIVGTLPNDGLRSPAISATMLSSENPLVVSVVESSPSLNVADGAILFLPNSGSFQALIGFLNRRIYNYKQTPCLMADLVDQAVLEVSTLEQAAFSNEFRFQLFHCLTCSSVLGSSPVQIATAQEISNILSPKRSWQEAFEGFYLDDLGVLCFQQSVSYSNQMVLSEPSSSVVLKRRGRPC
jgi:hypothetical protein